MKQFQKTFTEDFLTGTHKKNTGQLPQYYIENNHEPIVSKKVFYLVQAERQRRREYSEKYRIIGLLFSTGVRCGCCGSWYRVELRHKKGELTGYTFRCPYLNEKGEHCPTPSIPERKLKSSFLEAFNLYIAQRDRLKAKISSFINQKEMVESLNAQLDEFVLKLSAIREQMDRYSVSKNGCSHMPGGTEGQFGHSSCPLSVDSTPSDGKTCEHLRKTMICQEMKGIQLQPPQSSLIM